LNAPLSQMQIKKELSESGGQKVSPDSVRATTSLKVNRIYHTWDKWECYSAGFYDEKPKNREQTKEQLELEYADFLSNDDRFKAALRGVLTHWKKSCEHYLSNENMNRIAWLGQAAACYALGIPSCYRGGFNLLTEKQQERANEIALNALNKWLERQGEKQLTWEQAQSKTEANLY